jgi:hypothetical protein
MNWSLNGLTWRLGEQKYQVILMLDQVGRKTVLFSQTEMANTTMGTKIETEFTTLIQLCCTVRIGIH